MQPSSAFEELCALLGEGFKGESVVDVAGLCALLVGGEESFFKIGGIAHDNIEAGFGAPILGKVIALLHFHLGRKRGGNDVFVGLLGSCNFQL